MPVHKKVTLYYQEGGLLHDRRKQATAYSPKVFDRTG